jgi:hypothetical protein
MPWTITESSAPQAPVKPPGEPVAWDDIPIGTWLLLDGRDFCFKSGHDSLMFAGFSSKRIKSSDLVPCPPDWRFEARVVDGMLRFVPLVETEREEFDITCTENIGAGELVKCENGTWFVGSCVSAPVPLTNGGRSRRFRRPRGPVTLTYTPPETP